MKLLGVTLIFLIGLLQYHIWWGERSYREIDKLTDKISQQKAENQLLKEQNEVLKKEIAALRQNPEMLEEMARERLGLIKPGETFYRIIPKEDKK